MAAVKGPNVINSGLVLAMDAANPQSFRGIPTDNLLVNSGMSTYNNVGGDVTSVLVSTEETYRGATVFKQTLTATTGSGVSFLTNGNNPGIGVVTSGGGGVANRYTGHSIFFRTTVPMHSSPIFNHYSNIGGWQSCCNFDDMGDGFFRAHVIWFDSVTRSDGKFWAINPLSSTLNVPIDIFWAGPFKEDRNDSAVVSPFINGTRGTTFATGGGWADQSGEGGHGELENGPGFNSSNFGSLVFDGVNDIIGISNNAANNISGNITLDCWINRTSNTQGVIIHKEVQYTLIIRDNGAISYADSSLWSYAAFGNHGSVSLNTFNHIVATKSGSLVTIYLNGNVVISKDHGSALTQTNNELYLGAYDGSSNFFGGHIAKVRVYNRALSATEVQRNYNATRRRFGL